MFKEQEYLNNFNTKINLFETLFNDITVKMPEPQYLGCKYKILPWIFQDVAKEALKTVKNF